MQNNDLPYSRFRLSGPDTLFQHQISITSKTGAGSSSLLEGLKKKLGNFPYRWVSGGGLMRTRAAERGMKIEVFVRYSREHPEEGHDRWCDQQIANFASHDWVICEGRLPHIFMPGALRVFLECDLDIRAVRRHRDHPELSLDEVTEMIVQRDIDDDTRYNALYSGCHWPLGDFDLVLSSSLMTVEEEVELLLLKHSIWVDAIR